MTRYTSRADTPLKYHKFFWYVGLPIRAIYGVYSLYIVFSTMNGLDFYYALDLFFVTADIVLGILAFVGFFKWKSYAWYSMMAMLITQIVYSIVMIIIYSQYVSVLSSTTSLITRQVFQIIGVCLVTIYYYKRKLLFFDEGFNISGGQNQPGGYYNAPPVHLSNPPTEPAIPQRDTLASSLPFCNQCGVFLPAPDSRFCPHCGTEVKKV